ncbi:psbP domain-containing protein 6, chloroplastic isoform X1 [Prunus avium]|uniref:PsbP domain-containing protein 6, chloroplastic isoform X1 n=1 Tax=Prunus avium TaxID=42229 RepID=A0A6P5RJJ0_PRUAV|nr:psbP domain-containing protein 6, chloroplastic isoform X1 [Prunus avium]
MATGPLPPPITSSLISSSSNSHSTSSSRSKLPPLLSPSPLPRHNYQQQAQSKKRRELLLKGGLGLLPLALVESILKEPLTLPSAEAKEAVVGSFLPPSPSDPSFVLFKASAKDTPALRAGNVQPYQFIIPPTWKQMRVANILSGNYCQPKCAEPWVEVKFEDEKQGKLQVVASPLIRLTNKPNATIEDIGNPEKVIASLGPFVTGNTYDPDELLETTVEKRGDLTVQSFLAIQLVIVLYSHFSSMFSSSHCILQVCAGDPVCSYRFSQSCKGNSQGKHCCIICGKCK